MNYLLITTATCVPCKVMKPLVIDAADAAGAQLTVLTVEAGDEVLELHDVRAVPTLIKLDGDKEVARLRGKQSLADIKAFFAE